MHATLANACKGPHLLPADAPPLHVPPVNLHRTAAVAAPMGAGMGVVRPNLARAHTRMVAAQPGKRSRTEAAVVAGDEAEWPSSASSPEEEDERVACPSRPLSSPVAQYAWHMRALQGSQHWPFSQSYHQHALKPINSMHLMMLQLTSCPYTSITDSIGLHCV